MLRLLLHLPREPGQICLQHPFRQTAHPRQARGGGLVAVAEKPQIDAIRPPGKQPREGEQRRAADLLHRDRLRQIAKTPACHFPFFPAAGGPPPGGRLLPELFCAGAHGGEIAPRCHRLVAAVHHLHARVKMPRQRGPVARRHGNPPARLDKTGECLEKLALAGIELARDFGDLRLQGNERLAMHLRQPPQQRACLFLAQTGDDPVEPPRGQALRQRQRHPQRHAVGFLARGIGVAEGDHRITQRRGIGEGFVPGHRVLLQKISLGGAQEIGFAADAGADQSIEIVQAGNPGDPPRVKAVKRLVKLVQTRAAHLRQRSLQPFAHARIFGEKAVRDMRRRRVVLSPLSTGEKRAPDEKLRRLGGVHAPVVDLPPEHLQPVHEHPFPHQHPPCARAPLRMRMAQPAEVRADFGHPLRIDPRHHPGEKLRSLHDLPRHDPLRLPWRLRLHFPAPPRPLEKPRTGKDHRLPAPRRLVNIPLLALGNLAEQPRQHRPMHRPVKSLPLFAVRGILFPPLALALVSIAFPAWFKRLKRQKGILKLPVEIPPLPHPRQRKKVRLAKTAQSIAAGAYRPALRRRCRVPEIQECEKIRLWMRKRLVRRRGGSGFLRLPGPLAGIGHAQARRDNQHLREHPLRARLEQHPPQRRVHGEPRQLPPERSQRAPPVRLRRQRTEFLQHRVPRADRLRGRRVQKRKALHLAEPERLHPQDDLREIGALDLRLGEPGPLFEILLPVKTDAKPLAHPPRAACPLGGAALGDRLHRQAARPRARAVAADARQPRVDHRRDARESQRGFRDVGGDNYTPPPLRCEKALLLACGHPAKKPEHLHPRADARLQQLPRLADVAFRRHEDQHIAVRRLRKRRRRRARRRLHVPAVLLSLRLRRRVTDRDRKEPPGNLDHRRAVERLRERLRINRRGGDEQLEIRPPREQPPQRAEQEVDVQRPLVRFVEDQRRVGAQKRIGLHFGQQDAVRHELHARLAARVVAKAHLAADLPPPDAAKRREFFRHPARNAHRRHAARLRAADAAPAGKPRLQAELRELRRLARSGLPGNDHHLMRTQRRKDLLSPRADGEIRRVGDHARSEVGKIGVIGLGRQARIVYREEGAGNP